MTKYPPRPKCFSHKFCRLLQKACVAQEIGQSATLLLCFIAQTEDAARYSGPVKFWNSQLMESMGFRSPKQLNDARKRAIDAGWLVYLNRGTRTVGEYFVSIPDAYKDIPDTLMVDSHDESILSADGTNSGTNSGINQGANPGLIGYQSGTQCGKPSYPSPETNPVPVPEEKGRPAPSRVNASEKEIPGLSESDRKRWAELLVEPQPFPGMVDGNSTASLQSLERVDVVRWFQGALATSKPLTGPSALDLVLVLSCAAKSRTKSGIANRVAYFAARLIGGEWVNDTGAVVAESQWLAQQFREGKVKTVRQREECAA